MEKSRASALFAKDLTGLFRDGPGSAMQMTIVPEQKQHTQQNGSDLPHLQVQNQSPLVKVILILLILRYVHYKSFVITY